MGNSKIGSKVLGNDLLRYLILIYWSLFWLMNSVDKIIGGSHFLFVGKDRFASIERFFDSIGLAAPVYANIALIITAVLEILAFLFFTGSLYYLIKKDIDACRSWFFIGIVLTLAIFTYFSIGDQIFGDHGELLEHGIYWFITLITWVVFLYTEKIHIFENFSIDKKQMAVTIFLVAMIFATTAFSIFRHNESSFIERTQAVSALRVDDDLYKISFPFLAGSTAFENSISKFKKDNPSLEINYIYTTPHPLRLGKSDGLIIYIQTEKK